MCEPLRRSSFLGRPRPVSEAKKRPWYTDLMKTNILTAAVALSDRDLLARINALARTEREATAELVGHLAALELRPSLYADQGYGSLFDYCTGALRLSEDAACSRIRAARTCRSFPVILDLLYSGAINLTTVRLLQPHLTAENHQAVLVRATNRRREDIEALVAELAPRADVPPSVRKLPVPQPQRSEAPPPSLSFDAPDAPSGLVPSSAITAAADNGHPRSERRGLSAPTAPATPPPTVARPIVRALAPQRYRVQFTIGEETHGKLRRLQALMRREIPSGDVAVIFDQAVDLMLEKVERAKLGTKANSGRRSSAGRSDRAHESRIRFRTDKSSRHIPNAVRRAVWLRDAGQCAFVSAAGHRCTQRAFLELHHIHPYALEGPATVENIALRCRCHNQYEAELIFGPRERRRPVKRASRIREDDHGTSEEHLAGGRGPEKDSTDAGPRRPG